MTDRTKTFRRSGLRESTEQRTLLVEVVGGVDTGLTSSLGGRAIVGRAENVELRLTDPTVSQFHVELAASAAGVRIRDLGSHNGTYVGDALLREGTVPDGAELALGETVLKLTLGDVFEAPLSKATSFGALVGASPPMREMFAILERLARTDLGVLIEGDAGSGKESVARALVAAGEPARRRVHLVDCAALPQHLADGALVGPGGALASAAGETLLLEDIAELSASAQAALARALAARDPARPRLVSTSRADLRTRVNAGTFREDLYHLVAEARIRVPALRERRDDVGALVQYFLGQIPWDTQAARAIERSALDAIVGQTFPGNVRELRALVERVAKVAEGATITMADLGFARLLTAGHGGRAEEAADSSAPGTAATPGTAKTPSATDEPLLAFKEAKRSMVDDFERAYLEKLLARTGTNISRAASVAGIERQSMRALLRRHGLRADD